jgi:hypothetical protein
MNIGHAPADDVDASSTGGAVVRIDLILVSQICCGELLTGSTFGVSQMPDCHISDL